MIPRFVGVNNLVRQDQRGGKVWQASNTCARILSSADGTSYHHEYTGAVHEA
jgi:hypothetical protein